MSLRSGGLKRRNGRKPIAEMNVVPYIDVMLVLLVIFMVTAPILTQGVEVDLPKVASKPIESPEDNEPIVVTLDAKGHYYLEMGSDPKQSVSLDTVADKVAALVRSNPGIKVLVRGDTAVPYGDVIQLMSHLQAANVGNVGLISEPPER
ncbi:protein TolR [Terasakiispira papahanaumokuakeensis]|uniref:Tol-Pal system protein TolR n=1 Tax=Terasakiispira papahanaumokuakeensis TaxID=197479 RepID=A0A1E2V8U7_9GAMM|nr:protein TolR [Terasakiispira papahanaumokuakeensis]ODC03430.1 protein TolR [Terasakiispira papahanaumokuakeensis]